MRHRDEVVTLTSHAAALLRMLLRSISVPTKVGRPGDVYQMNGSEAWEWRFNPQGFAPGILVVYFGADGLVNRVTRVPESFGGGRTGRR